jgi:hypothetical protein
MSLHLIVSQARSDVYDNDCISDIFDYMGMIVNCVNDTCGLFCKMNQNKHMSLHAMLSQLRTDVYDKDCISDIFDYVGMIVN